MNEQEVTQTHFSENWAVEQVVLHARTGLHGWACVPHILRVLASKHRRGAFNALRIAHMLHLIEMKAAEVGDPMTSDELEMCPRSVEDKPLAWARIL